MSTEVSRSITANPFHSRLKPVQGSRHRCHLPHCPRPATSSYPDCLPRPTQYIMISKRKRQQQSTFKSRSWSNMDSSYNGALLLWRQSLRRSQLLVQFLQHDLKMERSRRPKLSRKEHGILQHICKRLWTPCAKYSSFACHACFPRLRREIRLWRCSPDRSI